MKRNKWCRDNLSGTPCPGEEPVARLGGQNSRISIDWRCYCPKALTVSKYTFDFDASERRYFSRHDQLTHVN